MSSDRSQQAVEWVSQVGVLALNAALALALSVPLSAAADAAQKLIGYAVVQRYHHASDAFTEGLELVDGALYESSGLYRESYVTRWRLGAAKVEQSRSVADEYFAEGFTVLGDNAYLLTWQSNRGLVLDAKTFAIKSRFDYPGEGWGLTNDRTSLIMSDGTAQLRFLDPTTLREQKRITVTENGKPLVYLNELEWIGAGALAPQPRVLANIWQTDQIAVIDPQSGVVTARIDLRKLYPQRRTGEDVMNGIAFDPADNTLLVTGKRWRYLWRIRVPAPLP